MSTEQLVAGQQADTASVGTSSINAREVSGSTHQLVQSINSAPTDYDYGDWITGLEMNGRISPARRFFCLLVTFDVLLCTIFWLVCVVLSGENVVAELEDQIICYSVQTSLFDVVAASLSRFLLLILVYAVIRIDHWWMIAMTTAASSVVCLLKILYFKWQSSSSSTTFQVTLIVSFFIVGWLEVWLYDHRVIPQESRARHINQIRYATATQRTSLVQPSHQRVRDYLSTCTGSVANFYSPMGTPEDSEDENENHDDGIAHCAHSALTEEAHILRWKAEDNCRQALDLLNSSDWTRDEEIAPDDFLFSRKHGKHVQFMFSCTVACPTETFANEVINNCNHCPEWNRAVSVCCQLQQVDAQCEVRYMRTNAFLGGVVSPRDFINLHLYGRKGLMFFSAVVSTEHCNDPRDPHLVRAVNGPTILTVQPCVNKPRHCIVVWLLNSDCRVGMVPRRLMDRGTRQAARDLHQFLQQLGKRLAAAEV